MRRCSVPALFLTLFASQINFSQTWVRHVDGFSMWSIAKDYAGNIYAGTTGSNRGIFKSTDGGITWTNMFSTGVSNYLEIACDSLNNIYIANVSNGLLKSTDGGQNFTVIPASTFGGGNVNTVACGINGYIFVGVTNGGIWRSTDFGTTFNNTGALTNTIVSFAVDKFDADRIYAGSSSSSLNGFFISTDGGLTFGASTISVNIWQILQTSSNSIYIATTSSPYSFNKSTDGGLTWTAVGTQPGAMRGAALDLLEDIYISGNGGVYKSIDGGATFNNHNLTFSSNKIITFENKVMVCVTGSTNGGVWVFTDTQIPVELTSFTAGASTDYVELNWATATELNNSGFNIERSKSDELQWEVIGFVPGFGTTTEMHSYSFTDSDVQTGHYSYRLKQIDFDGTFEYSHIVKVEVDTPLEFILEQNYPNPFNPSTKIKFTVPALIAIRQLPEKQSQLVTLKIYDILGNEIATLVNDELSPGEYEVEFNTSSIKHLPSSGIYFYTLKAGDFVQTKKMILLK